MPQQHIGSAARLGHSQRFWEKAEVVSLWETRSAAKPTFSSFQDASGQLMKGHAPVQALCDARRKGACNGTLSAPRNRRIRGVLGRSDALLARIWYAIQTQARTGSGCLQAAYGRRSWRRLCDGCRKGGMSALQRHIEVSRSQRPAVNL